MATSTIHQDHSSAMTVTSVPGNSTLTVTFSSTGARGIILVGGMTDNNFPYICGFRFTDGGSLNHKTSPSGNTVITIARGSTKSITLKSTTSNTTPIVIFMENRSVSSIESAANSASS